MQTKNQEGATQLHLISQAFRAGSPIPPQYTCKGQNVNPPFSILNTPAKAQSLTLIMHDPDSVRGDFLHWLMWDIPPSTESINAHSVPVGAIQGLNGSGTTGYIGPCPPAGTGTHRYIFELYALDTTLDLPSDATREDVIKAMKGHVLGQNQLVGLFSAS